MRDNWERIDDLLQRAENLRIEGASPEIITELLNQELTDGEVKVKFRELKSGYLKISLWLKDK